MQPEGRGDQLLATGVELSLGQPLRRDARQCRDLRDRPPLQLGRLGVEPQLGCDLKEPLVELSIDTQAATFPTRSLLAIRYSAVGRTRPVTISHATSRRSWPETANC